VHGGSCRHRRSCARENVTWITSDSAPPWPISTTTLPDTCLRSSTFMPADTRGGRASRRQRLHAGLPDRVSVSAPGWRTRRVAPQSESSSSALGSMSTWLLPSSPLVRHASPKSYVIPLYGATDFDRFESHVPITPASDLRICRRQAPFRVPTANHSERLRRNANACRKGQHGRAARPNDHELDRAAKTLRPPGDRERLRW